MTDDERMLLEMDYTTYDMSCRDPHISEASELLECRLGRGHSVTHHATRKGVGVVIWNHSH